MRALLFLAGCGACGSHDLPAGSAGSASHGHPATESEDPRHPTVGVVRVDGLPRLAGERWGRFDARLSTALASAFGVRRARSCGVLEREASATDRASSHACVVAALAADEEFVYVESIAGTDSDVARATIGQVEAGSFTVYQLSYDSDPCGGGCPERGGTTLRTCASKPISEATCAGDLVDCFGCPHAEAIDSWHAGALTDVTDADAERLVSRVIGPTPASFGSFLAGLHVTAGVPTSPAAVRETTIAAAAGGTLEVATAGGDKLFEVTLRVAGHCGALHEQLVAAWGPSPDRVWIDPAAHQRALLDYEGCMLHIGPYAEVPDWIADTTTAPVPLGIIGHPAAALRARLRVSYSVSADAHGLQWHVAAVGRLGGPIRVDADSDHGRITRVLAIGQTDHATIERLRARLIELRGKPFQDDTINGGRTRYTGWLDRPLELSVGDDGSFELEARAR